MSVTKTYANTMLSNLFASGYIGLSLTQPNDEGGNVTEPVAGSGYARVAAANGNFTATAGTITNRGYIYFPEATAAWGTVLYLCVFDGSASSARLRYYGALTTPKDIEISSVPLFRPNSINVSITEG